MKNKLLKIAIIFFILALFISILAPKNVYALRPADITGTINDEPKLDTDFIENIEFLIRTIGLTIAAGALMIIGIKYVTGSVEEKAEYKKTMMPYLIGCFILMGASTITPKILDIFKGAKDTQSIFDISLGLIFNIGIVVSVGVLMILGIKYMIGTLEERASYKKSMVPWVVGVVLLDASIAIMHLIYYAIGLDPNT